jgi:hypothetical protein
MRPRRHSPLTVAQILAWADRHRRRTLRWPRRDSGPVAGAPGAAWVNVHQALLRDLRGLPGGSSLSRLLAERGGKPPRARANPLKPRAGPLTVGQILRWAERHFRSTGRWLSAASGAVTDAPGEHGRALDSALRHGFRGLPGGDSLARLLRGRHQGAG